MSASGKREDRLFVKLGNLRLCREGLAKLAVPRIVVRLGVGVCFLPLTPTLFPEEREKHSPVIGNTTELGCRVPPN
jgi:hypothetical protein